MWFFQQYESKQYVSLVSIVCDVGEVCKKNKNEIQLG